MLSWQSPCRWPRREVSGRTLAVCESGGHSPHGRQAVHTREDLSHVPCARREAKPTCAAAACAAACAAAAPARATRAPRLWPTFPARLLGVRRTGAIPLPARVQPAAPVLPAQSAVSAAGASCAAVAPGRQRPASSTAEHDTSATTATARRAAACVGQRQDNGAGERAAARGHDLRRSRGAPQAALAPRPQQVRGLRQRGLELAAQRAQPAVAPGVLRLRLLQRADQRGAFGARKGPGAFLRGACGPASRCGTLWRACACRAATCASPSGRRMAGRTTCERAPREG